MKRWTRRAAALAGAVVLALTLAGCGKMTITVTGKYRSMIGWYYVCDGPSYAPCGKYSTYHVSYRKWLRARIGHKLTINRF